MRKRCFFDSLRVAHVVPSRGVEGLLKCGRLSCHYICKCAWMCTHTNAMYVYKCDVCVSCVCVLIWKEKADVLKLAVDGLEKRWTNHSRFYRFKLKFSMSNFRKNDNTYCLKETNTIGKYQEKSKNHLEFLCPKKLLFVVVWDKISPCSPGLPRTCYGL